MPVISRTTFFVLGVKFKRTTSVLATGIFRMKIPVAVQELLRLQYPHVEAATLDECARKWKAAVKEAEAASSSEKKVILYRLAMNDGTRYQGRDSDFAFGYGYVLGIEVGVFSKRTTELSDGGKRYKYSLVESSIPKEAVSGKFSDGIRNDAEYAARRNDKDSRVVELAWTEKREEFFHAIAMSMCDMMDKLKALSKPKILKALSKKGAPQYLLGMEG